MKLFYSKYRLALCCSLIDALISLLKSLFSTAYSGSACEIIQNIGMIYAIIKIVLVVCFERFYAVRLALSPNVFLCLGIEGGVTCSICPEEIDHTVA